MSSILFLCCESGLRPSIERASIENVREYNIEMVWACFKNRTGSDSNIDKGKKEIVQLKKRWLDVMESDLKMVGVSEESMEDWVED